MKRALIVAALATVMLLAIAAPALANEVVPPTTYKLTVSAYFDADGDGTWDACEPPLAGVKVKLLGDGYVYTDKCGWAKICVPAGATVCAMPVAVFNPCYGPYRFVTEATPSSGMYGIAKVTMKGNRCILFGIAPCWKVPYCNPCCPWDWED